jgi:putative transposase
LHKISHQLISENQVIVSEDLAVSNMIKNHNLAKAISDCGWYELTRQLTYKAEWNGRTYIKIGRYVPSSQTCNICGYVNKDTKDLSVREWICPECGTKHDRDINAAINILNEGLRLLETA